MIPKLILLLAFINCMAAGYSQSNYPTMFSSSKSDSTHYRANPMDDSHEKIKTIKEVKLTPAQARKMEGKTPLHQNTGANNSEITKSNGIDGDQRGNTDTGANAAQTDTTTISADTNSVLLPGVAGTINAMPAPGYDSYRHLGKYSAYTFISICSLLALLGMFIIILTLDEKQGPYRRTMLFGLLGTLATTSFIMYVVHNPCLPVAVITFAIAALSAAILVYSDMQRKILPVWLGMLLGALGVLGVIAEIIYCAMHQG
jgi:uncharacterized membrane protein